MNSELEAAKKAAAEETKLILAGTCPRCGRPMEGKFDPYQQGPSAIVGKWWNHKCTSCGYFCDVIHPDNN